MFELDAKKYCERCNKFKPDINYVYANNEVYITIISCSHRDQCAAMYDYLKNKKVRIKTMKAKEYYEQYKKRFYVGMTEEELRTSLTDIFMQFSDEGIEICKQRNVTRGLRSSISH